MKITRISQFTGVEHTREMPGVTQERLDQCWSQNPHGREGVPPGTRHIQDVFPELGADDREFLMTGVTPEEWADAFGSDED